MTPLRIDFPALSWLLISSGRLEVKVLRFDGCVGYAQPIHTHNFGPLAFRPCMVKVADIWRRCLGPHCLLKRFRVFDHRQTEVIKQAFVV